MTIKYLESCGAATFGLEFWDSTVGTVGTEDDGAGLRRIYFGTGTSQNASIRKTNCIGQSGRLNFHYRYVSLSGTIRAWTLSFRTASLNSFVVVVRSGGNSLEVINGADGTSLAIGTASVKTGNLQRISVAWSVTSSSVNEIRVWVDGTLDISITNATITNATGLQDLYVGEGGGPAYLRWKMERGFYIDDDGGLTDPGDIRVTAKLPAANNASGFDTGIGASPSNRYENVDDRALSITTGWQQAAATQVQENYTLQAANVGDVDLNGATFLAHLGWLYGKRDAGYPYPTVRSTGTFTEGGNTTSHSVVLPATVSSGDFLWAAFTCDGAPTVTWDNTTAGTWTDYIDTANGADCRLVIKAKIADGTEGGKTLTIGTSASEQSVSRTASLRADSLYDSTLANSVNIPSAATGTSANPDPPVATDSWGAVNRRTLAVFGCDFSRTVTTYPTGYDLNQYNDVSGGGAGCGLANAAKDAVEGSQNPGTYTISASDQWVAATVSVRGDANYITAEDTAIMLNGTEYSITLTAASAMYTKLIESSSYPSNAAGIGMRSTGNGFDTYLYECGVIVAYIPAPPRRLPNLQMLNRAAVHRRAAVRANF